jgi:hypothetical protein
LGELHDIIPHIIPPFESRQHPQRRKRMNSASQAPTRTRPKCCDINLSHFSAPGLLSIFSRIGGAAKILVLNPQLLFFLQQKLRSEAGFMLWKIVSVRPLQGKGGAGQTGGLGADIGA